MTKTTPVVVLCAVAMSAASQTPRNELESVLQQADTRRKEYVETFKDVTAVETRVTEIFDKNGRVEKQRRVVSDFLVYRSELGDEGVNEYRVAREVDGKAVDNPAEDALKRFRRLASAKTLAQQSERLRDANLKYMLGYYSWGLTLQPLGVVRPQQQQNLDFSIAGRERLAGRDTIVLGYRHKELRPAPTRGIYRHFKSPRSGARGSAWLDVDDGRLRRWEHEMLVADREITTPVVLVRDEIEYEPSTFGVLTPKRIVASFFDKSGDKKAPDVLRLAGRITFTYEAFKRFQVTTDTEIQHVLP